MTEDFDEFDDFDADISNAAQAEAQEEEVEEQPVVAARKTAAPARKAAQPAPVAQPQQHMQTRRQRPAPGTTPAQKTRFEAYSTPKKYGVIDNSTGNPFMEAEDPINLVIGLIVDMKNDLEEIKESL